jgi:hypothetical protein
MESKPAEVSWIDILNDRNTPIAASFMPMIMNPQQAAASRITLIRGSFHFCT